MTDNFAIAMLFSRSATLSKKRCLSTSLFLLCAEDPFELERWDSAEIEGALSRLMLPVPSLKARPVVERRIGEDVHLKMRECPIRAGKIIESRDGEDQAAGFDEDRSYGSRLVMETRNGGRAASAGSWV
jgi:hypothetical protein